MLLDHPPDFIIISLIDNRTHKIRSKSTIPADFNLIQDESSDKIMIPIPRKDVCKLQVGSSKNAKITCNNHPLELGFAFTVWKVQGLTFDKVILWLNRRKGKRHWTLENLYVAFSRVRTANGIRCFPLTKKFKSSVLRNLVPDINATRWRMDTKKGNKWEKNPASASLRNKVKAIKSQTSLRKEASEGAKLSMRKDTRMKTNNAVKKKVPSKVSQENKCIIEHTCAKRKLRKKSTSSSATSPIAIDDVNNTSFKGTANEAMKSTNSLVCTFGKNERKLSKMNEIASSEAIIDIDSADDSNYDSANESGLISIYEGESLNIGTHHGLQLSTADLRVLKGEYVSSDLVIFYGRHLINESCNLENFLMLDNFI